MLPIGLNILNALRFVIKCALRRFECGSSLNSTLNVGNGVGTFGIDPDFLCHHLSMDTTVRPVRQRRRKFNEERQLVVREETQKLLSAGHIREIQYPEWLANVVLVKKANGKWRMCMDFTNLNKVCPKDSYPLPIIDTLVDSASGCKVLSFLDTFSGYNQIKMHPRNESKIAFMIETCSYCYKVDAFWAEKRGRHLPKADGQGPSAHVRKKCVRLRG